MARLAAIFVTLFAAVSLAQSEAAPDCFQYGSCYDCVTAPSGLCGWDPSRQVCAHGTSSGPVNQASWSGQWSWTSDKCCSTYSSCGACASQANCGWSNAQSVGQCMHGTQSGPSNTAAATGPWVWDDSNCNNVCYEAVGGCSYPAYQCQFQYDCNSCSNTYGCSWDSSAYVCSYSGNGYSTSSCNAYTWDLYAGKHSISMWVILGSGLLMFIFFVVLGRRRRAILMRQRQQQSEWLSTQSPVTATPLINSQAVYGQPIDQSPCQVPVYGSQDETVAPAPGCTPA